MEWMELSELRFMMRGWRFRHEDTRGKKKCVETTKTLRHEVEDWISVDELARTPATIGAKGDLMLVEHIQRTLDEHGIAALQLSISETDAIIQDIKQRFCDPLAYDRYLWETFNDDESRQRQDGWLLLCDFPMERPILFVPEYNRYHAFQFLSTTDLRLLLSESQGFEFYVTTESTDFVLCHNHHDYLIGVGTCIPWLAEITEDE